MLFMYFQGPRLVKGFQKERKNKRSGLHMKGYKLCNKYLYHI